MISIATVVFVLWQRYINVYEVEINGNKSESRTLKR